MRTIRLVTATSAAVLCLAALNACGPDNSGDQNASKTTAPTAAATTPATGTATGTPTGAPATTGGQGKPTGGATAPAGDGIPAKAWMDTKNVPMDATLHWAPLAANAKPVTGPVTFKAQDLCHAPIGKDDESTFTGQAAGKALVGFGADHWMAQQTLLYHGDPTHSSGTKQLTGLTRTHLTDAVKNCAKTAPGATVKVSSPDDAPYFAATATIPQSDGSTVTLHEYVLDAGGTVSELSVFATTKAGAQPKEAWTAPEDKYVATGMTAPACEAFPGC
ncbi:hypothetical protein KV557_20895 [Kitasatospora aureofaciens]|uniref:hypothetical protein n=1 Tax=Kitasatospora aureofaciens TaxID=1894 RepID=UPI001C467B12|nr:hypothetical protein [Kitasatospora aureofaciens]MBV6699522.1 hypothetical protein [Kitasatospora aureofaciens]